MRVRDAHEDVFTLNAIEFNIHKIYIKSDERLAPSVTGVPTAEEANTVMIQTESNQ
jgi:hypothetical protein